MKRIIWLYFIILLICSSAWAQTQWGLEAGMQAPDFTALSHEGKEIKLSDVYQKTPVILIFYRGGWCYYCNLHLQAFQSNLDDFKKRGVTLLALSVDTVDNAAQSVKDKKLGFDVISNPNANILELYNLAYQVPDELFELYKKKYDIDLEAASGKTHHTITVPAIYIIDQTGKILYGYADENYKVRKSPKEILKMLDHGVISDPAKFKMKQNALRFFSEEGYWGYFIAIIPVFIIFWLMKVRKI